jgi:aspartate kinase
MVQLQSIIFVSSEPNYEHDFDMPDLIKVAKFGGTSLADAVAMQRCASIIEQDSDKRVIVLSATSGTTNLLASLSTIEDKSSRQSVYEQIKDNHQNILRNLELPDIYQVEIDRLLDELKKKIEIAEPYDIREMDTLLSFGERLSSKLFTGLLKSKGIDAEYVDAREIIKTNSQYGNAEPLVDQIRDRAESTLRAKIKTKRLVTQGFIGSDKSGSTTTLGRGGSDYTAALLAEALDADVLEIWTDVNAIYTTDPRICEEAVPITEMTFDEAAELSFFGAKVLHPATLKPAIRKNIKVYVGSSIYPDQPGTWIVKSTPEKPIIRAISLRPEQTLITVHSLDMLHRHGFLAKLFQILAEHKISVDLVTTSEVSVSLTIDTNQKGLYQRLSPEMIKELENIAEVQIEEGLALIALVGNNLDSTAGVSGPLFNMLDDINIRMICHGASSHNLCFLVDQKAAESVVQKLHKYFIPLKVEN